MRDGIYREIETERAAQDTEWGGPEHDDTHGVGDWESFIHLHLSRAMAAPINNDGPVFRRQMIRVAALAVAAVEWFDRWEARAGR